jgi:hypothetical protein
MYFNYCPHRLTVTVTAGIGGYMKLVNNGPYTTQYYSGQTTSKVMEYRFDFIDPSHCFQHKTCTHNEVALSVGPDITKVTLFIHLHTDGHTHVQTHARMY